MIQKYKKQLIFASIITLLPMLIGVMMWNVLPEHMATHWNASGEADGWSARTFAIFGMPCIMLAIQWICVFVTSLDSKNRNQNHKVIRMMFWLLPFTSLITSGVVYAAALGRANILDFAVRALLGIMFVVMGNYLPKCKQNRTIGIKVAWTLKSEENWNKTHRFCGKMWVIGGVAFLATTFIPMESFVYAFLAILLLLVVVPILYSYLYYKKQKKEGTLKETEITLSQEEKRFAKIGIGVGVIITVFAMVFLFTGNFEVQLDEDSFTIEAAYWDDATINYTEIDHIELRQQDNPGSRTFGYGSFSLMMGEFENDEFGAYTRYSHTSCDDCIVLSVKGKTLVINGKDEDATKKLYEELAGRVSK